MLISSDYAALNRDLHASRPDYGTSGVRWAETVSALAEELRAASILDYGCGKQTLAAALPGLKLVGYDPALPGLDSPPEPADLVVCTDVLEHVEPDCIDDVLDDLCRVTSKLALVTVATRPAVKTLSDGRNAHLTVKPFSWWREGFLTRFDLVEVVETEGFEFCLLLKALHADLDISTRFLTGRSISLAIPSVREQGGGIGVGINERMEVVHEGQRITFCTPNAMTRWRVRSLYEKEPDTIRWLQNIPQGSVFLDVGANVGMYSIFAASVRRAKVFSFEPESQNFALLNQNIEANSLSGRVIAYPLALSDEMALRPLYLSDFSPGGSCHSFGEKVGFDLRPRAEAFSQGSFAVTIDHLVASGSMPCPDYMKVDVDGFEHKVLQGARKTLADPRLRGILIELNTNLDEHQAVIQELTNLGFAHDPAQARAALRTSGIFKGVGEFIFHRSETPAAFDFERGFTVRPPRSRDEWRVLQHIQERMANAHMETDPFPYLVVDNIFPEDYYRRMLENFPSPEVMRPLHESGRVAPGAYEERHALLFNEEEISKLSMESAKFWRSLAHWMYSDPFANLFISRFAQELFPRLARILQADGKLAVKGDALLVQDHTRYAIGPHTDAPHRLVTFLFYLPTDDSMRDIGTSIYRPKDPDFTCWGGPHHSFDHFEKVRTVEFLPNRLLVFPKTERSFHGVEKIERKEIERRLLINNVRVLNEVRH